MNPHRFDTLAHTLGTSATRRSAIKTLAGGVLAAAVAPALAAGAAAGTCREIFQRCTSTDQCCGSKSGRTACRRNPQFGLSDGKSCCIREGQQCGFGGQCCGGLDCTGQPDGTLACGTL